MKLQYFKKFSIVLLLGFIFVSNAIPVSFGAVSTASCHTGNTCPSNCTLDPDPLIPCTNGVSCICTTADCTQSETDIANAIKNTKCETPLNAVWNISTCKTQCSCDEKCAKALTTETSLLPGLPNIPNPTITPYVAKVTIPRSKTALGASGQCPAANNPAGYIARIYQFGLMIVGFVALGAMIFGAALYTLSAGNMASKEEGKAWMLERNIWHRAFTRRLFNSLYHQP